ncbi:hypothetical protein D7V97_40620 [Corallococcus sp. CA053C]|nr:hypothetical protein D7V97_40620 [Corallococcus sp. CA053C]
MYDEAEVCVLSLSKESGGASRQLAGGLNPSLTQTLPTQLHPEAQSDPVLQARTGGVSQCPGGGAGLKPSGTQ